MRRTAHELQFDSISRVDLQPWSDGRVAVVGDTACRATLGGMGTGTAVVAAYARPTGRFLAPRTGLGAQLRNRLLGNRLLLNLMLKEGQQVSGKIALTDYPVGSKIVCGLEDELETGAGQAPTPHPAPPPTPAATAPNGAAACPPSAVVAR
jgi:hypothetical protein